MLAVLKFMSLKRRLDRKIVDPTERYLYTDFVCFYLREIYLHLQHCPLILFRKRVLRKMFDSNHFISSFFLVEIWQRINEISLNQMKLNSMSKIYQNIYQNKTERNIEFVNLLSSFRHFSPTFPQKENQRSID